MSSAGIIDFEDVDATVTPPFVARSGALGELKTGGTLTRGVARFDVVTNIGEQTKPSEFGERSLDPFFIQEDTTPFKFDIDSGTGERDFFLANTVSITVGDYGEDEDKIVLQAFSNTDVLLGEATATLPASETDFTFTTLTVTSKYGEQIDYIKFIGGSAQFPNSVFYDNITLTYVPTENELKTSNPYWNRNIEAIADEIVKQIFKDALTGKGEKFAYLIPSGGNSTQEPITPYQRENRDETTTKATEALKIGSKEWIEQVQNYLNENNRVAAELFDLYKQTKGLSWNIFIAALQTADLAVKISEQTGLKPYDPRVLISAGIQPYGDLADDIALELLPELSLPGTEPPPFLPNPIKDYIGDNIKLGTYAVKQLQSSNTTPQSFKSESLVQNEFLFSVEEVSPNNEANTILASETIESSIQSDKLLGTVEDDYLFGKAGNDILEGNEGWDVLIGDVGNDLLIGGDGSDMLNGNGTSFVVGIDTLIGGAGVDIFVLGDPERGYYDDQNPSASGINDYALITDFNPNQDFIVLKGKFSDYVFQPNETATGQLIFLNNDGVEGFSPNDELIAKVEGVVNLSPIDFMFV